MKSAQLSFRPGFRLSLVNARSQGAVMVLPVGGKEGGPDNMADYRLAPPVRKALA